MPALKRAASLFLLAVSLLACTPPPTRTPAPTSAPAARDTVTPVPAANATIQPDATGLACGLYNTVVVCKDGTHMTSMLITPKLCEDHGGIASTERLSCK